MLKYIKEVIILFFMQNKVRKIIYIYGNPLLSFDNLPITLKPKLEKKFPGINFIIKDPNENIKPLNGEIVLIDTVVGLEKVTIINDINKIKTDSSYSMHDLDLGLNLKLLHKIGKLKKITILGVPPHFKEKTALEQLIQTIEELLK